jgi:hypothetical protein
VQSPIVVRERPIEYFEQQLSNAISRSESGNSQIDFTEAEAEAFQVIAMYLQAETPDPLDFSKPLQRSNSRASLSKQLRMLNKRMQESEEKLQQQVSLIKTLKTTAATYQMEVEAKNAEVEQLTRQAATDPTAQILLPKAKAELERKLNDLLVLNNQIKNFTDEIEKIGKEISLIQQRINEVIVLRRQV